MLKEERCALTADDPRLEDYRCISDRELLERRGIFVAEGRLVVSRLLAGRRFGVRSVLVTEAARAALDDVLRTRPDVPAMVVAPGAVQEITGFNIHRGCLAIGERPAPADWRHLAADARLLVVLEHVGNPDNVGGVFRNAAAFGASAVLLGPRCVDPLYRKAIRTSMGASLAVPFASVEEWPHALMELCDREWAVVGLTSSAPTSLRDVTRQLDRDAPVALVLGHEGDGLTAEALAACTHRAAIPMSPGSDSLNVAAASAIALYEIQERQHQGPMLNA